MFSARRFNEAINGIISVIVAWIHSFVAKENCLLGPIVDVGNIPDGVVQLI
jgi:hypothetical protein